MRKYVKKLTGAGLLFLFIAVTCLVFIDWLKTFNQNLASLIIVLFFLLAIIFLSIATNLLGKGDFLILTDLISGVEYFIIEHVSINGNKSFTLVGRPNSEKFIAIHGDDNLFSLLPKQSFVILKGEVKKLS